jgi:hypothetical protein
VHGADRPASVHLPLENAMTKEEHQIVVEAIDDSLDLLREQLDTIEASLALLTAVATRTETRLCKLIEHLGAKHIIESR